MNTDKINGSASTKASDIATTTVCKDTLLALYITRIPRFQGLTLGILLFIWLIEEGHFVKECCKWSFKKECKPAPSYSNIVSEDEY